MKKILLLILLSVVVHSATIAQNREDAVPEQLSYKSQEIKAALFWSLDSNTGKWVSRTARSAVSSTSYKGNFRVIFIGQYKNHRYMFIERMAGAWRYPNIKVGHFYYVEITAFLISDDDYNELKNISQDGEVITIKSDFYNDAPKRGTTRDISFTAFLSQTESLRSRAERMGEKTYHSPITAKRVMSDGVDVVRFRLDQYILFGRDEDTIDDNYFEVKYSEFQKLFLPDKKVAYK